MNKRVMKGLMMLGLFLSLGLHSIKADAQIGDGFKGVPSVTKIEAGSGFSTTSGIKLIEDGRQKNYSVYLYKAKTGYRKVSSTHFIDRRINGTYMIRYESSSGKHKAWRKVIIKDTKKPIFSGIKNVNINYGSKFSTTKGITAYDLASGKRGYSVFYKNKKVSKKNYINSKKVGYHKLRYEVKDKAGNKTIAYRNVRVLPKIQKTSKKKITVKASGRMHTIYPKYQNESGFWYTGYSKIINIHSYAGENLNRFKKGDIINFKIGNTWYKYIVYDKFICYASRNSGYYGVPAGKAWVAPSRGKDMWNSIDKAQMALQTCQDNGYSKVKYVLAKPYGNSKTWKVRSMAQSTNPQ